MLAESRQVYADLLAAVKGLTDADLNNIGRYKYLPADVRPWRIISGNSYSHYPEHVEQIQAWLATQEP